MVCKKIDKQPLVESTDKIYEKQQSIDNYRNVKETLGVWGFWLYSFFQNKRFTNSDRGLTAGNWQPRNVICELPPPLQKKKKKCL